MNPGIIPDGSINGEGNQIGSGSCIPFDNSSWKCDVELCTVLHNNCNLCKDWIGHHDCDTTSFEQAKACFHTGRDEASVSNQVRLEQETMAARKETEALLREIQEGEAEMEWVTRDEKTIQDGTLLQLQVVGGFHEIGGAPRHTISAPSEPSQTRKRQHRSGSAPSEPSQPWKRQRQTYTPFHGRPFRPMTSPFASEHAGSGSEQDPIYIGSESEGGDDTAP